MITFDHVHLFCTDLDAMVEFWTKAFKAEFVKYRKFGTADGAVLTLGGVLPGEPAVASLALAHGEDDLSRGLLVDEEKGSVVLSGVT